MDEYIPQSAGPDDDGARPQPPVARKRRVALPLFLFALTGLSTFWAGSLKVDPFSAGTKLVAFDFWAGLTYMACVLSILLAHEMGHFLTAVYYRVPASLPYFIPMPLMPMGTMGAVIAMQGTQADRRQLFDIGLAGPIAGLFLAVPIAWYGVATAEPYHGPTVATMWELNDPLLLQWFAAKLHPDQPVGTVYESNPFYLAGWLGLFITGLNMLPVSQLDGGHTAYGLFGRNARVLGRGLMFYALLLVGFYGETQWIVMLVLIFMLGVDHPPTSNDRATIGPLRFLIGLAALTLPILCLPKLPISVAGG